MPFDQWMHRALYAPGFGYYSAGLQKLATRDSLNRSPTVIGDFVTAPEISAAFGYTLAQQAAQVLRQQSAPTILEFGAGSGQLAHDVLTALAELGLSPKYQILEVSADLRQRQQQLLRPWQQQVQWLDALPRDFEGVALANEVLDAMPVHLVGWGKDAKVFERGVIWQGGQFAWQDRPAAALLSKSLTERMPALPGYITEINLAAQTWVSQINHWLKSGLVLLIDYGFAQHEYYHPQRRDGTLMCHIQHRSHSDPLQLPGLQDITAHVDFTAMANSAFDVGLDVLGYTSQARFLLNAGLLDLVPKLNTTDRHGLDTLVSEAQMGELFKVLAIGRGIQDDLIGFGSGDRRHQL